MARRRLAWWLGRPRRFWMGVGLLQLGTWLGLGRLRLGIRLGSLLGLARLLVQPVALRLFV